MMSKEDLEYLEFHAKNMYRALNNGDYRHVSQGNRQAIKDEIVRTVKCLKGFGVDLKYLLK